MSLYKHTKGYTAMNINDLKSGLESGIYNDKFAELYTDESMTAFQQNRYLEAVKHFESLYSDTDIAVFSAPGRTEIGGNHTDHQHGCVLAASINLDTVGIAAPTDNGRITLVSGDNPSVSLSIDDLEPRASEYESTIGLIRGVAAGFVQKGFKIGGFNAYITGNIPMGAGLSSSASFEVLIGNILSGLYNDMTVSPVDIARIGQMAENRYFGKPCGLLDQMACSLGNLVNIDFADPVNPVARILDCDFSACGYRLCITDTKGSHANLSDEYAAIPSEMKQVAEYFDCEYLNDTAESDIIASIGLIRDKLDNDRALLRSLHYHEENKRVGLLCKALENNDMPGFLSLINASGNSSYKYLQNVYSYKNIKDQSISLALALSEIILQSNGACRVHGGGFAGTIQAFVPCDTVSQYKEAMDSLFGPDSCHELCIRSIGGCSVMH